MPKISDAQRELRREHFLNAAWRCFSRSGVTATTMDDITREAQSSAGGTYLYFTTKDELIRAAITSSVDDFEQLVASVASSPAGTTRATFVSTLLEQTERFGARHEGVNLFAIAVQGWAYAQGDEETARIIRTRSRRILTRFADAASNWGLAADRAEQTAELIGSVVLGFITQKALGTGATAKEHIAGLEL